MDPVLASSLVALALLDSTSFGTLLIPLWLMTSPGEGGRPLRAGRILLFLAVVATFYLVVGAALLLGGTAVVEGVGDSALASPVVRWLQLALGVGLFAASFRYGGQRSAAEGGGRLLRWRDRAVAGESSARRLVTLALVAAGLELATMLPYLGAIGLLTASALPTPPRLLVLAAYCLVMVAPALVLLGLRAVLRDRVDGALRRVSRWLERAGGEATAWALGIGGFLLAGDAAQSLFL